MARCRVAIIIPALNEAKTVYEVVKAVSLYGDVVVVDDGSSDDTARLATLAGASVVMHPQNLGYDAALNSGFREALSMGAEVLITVDADGQHNPSLIELMVASIDSGADVVVGIRNKKQRLAEYVFSFYTYLLYGIQDPLCGMKAYKRNVYSALGHFDSLTSVGTELMIFAAKSRFKVKQIYFNVTERNGPSRFGSLVSANFKILRAMFLVILYVKKYDN